MTDHDPARDLLAEALQGPHGNMSQSHLMTIRPSDAAELAKAVSATPAGTRLLAAVRDGLALERLPREGGWAIVCGEGYPFRVVIYGRRRNWIGTGPTLPEAIAAALGDQS